ncbi:MAG: hypothetical protein E6R03_14010 [Hyphomicrobiaceae bacterium]|nr:MAG: hypothetical protein E6R03_14010 [Hyphomicrobiaceae bacterium]
MRRLAAAIFLFVLVGAARADEIHTRWPVPAPPAEQKPAPPSSPPAPPATEEKPKEAPKPAKPPAKPPTKTPEPIDPVEDCIDGCDAMRAEGLKACKDNSVLPPPKDCRGNISNAAAECIHQCRGY